MPAGAGCSRHGLERDAPTTKPRQTTTPRALPDVGRSMFIPTHLECGGSRRFGLDGEGCFRADKTAERTGGSIQSGAEHRTPKKNGHARRTMNQATTSRPQLLRCWMSGVRCSHGVDGNFLSSFQHFSFSAFTIVSVFDQIHHISVLAAGFGAAHSLDISCSKKVGFTRSIIHIGASSCRS